MFFKKPSVDKIEVEPLVHLTEAKDETIEVEKSNEKGEVSSKSEAGKRGEVQYRCISLYAT